MCRRSPKLCPVTKRYPGPESERRRNTPAAIIDKLNRETNAALADPKLKAQLADFGATVMTGSPADFGKFIAAEIDKWAKVIKFANIKAE